MDRRTEIPNRTKLLNQALELMAKEGESGKGWVNLPSLLAGVEGARIAGRGRKGEREARRMGKVVRMAGNVGRLGVVVQCLREVERTGMSLRDAEVLDEVLWQLHAHAQRGEWSEEAVGRARKWAEQVAGLLERQEHGGGSYVRGRDVRMQPKVIGVFLELAAVNAYKYQGGKDVDGKVKAYTERLLACIRDQAQVRPTPFTHFHPLPFDSPLTKPPSLPPDPHPPPAHKPRCCTASPSSTAYFWPKKSWVRTSLSPPAHARSARITRPDL